jgi:hypothetical protein
MEMNKHNKHMGKECMRMNLAAVRAGALVAGVLAVMVLGASLNGQTSTSYSWNTTDDYQYVPGWNSVPWGMTRDPAGNVYVAGVGRTNASAKLLQTAHDLIRQLSSSGGTWRLVSDFEYAPGKDSAFLAIASDSSTNLFVVGYGLDSSFEHWITLRSGDAGKTWQLVDNYLGPFGNGRTDAWGVFAGASGSVYVAGGAETPLPLTKKSQQRYVSHWIIRGPAPDATWTTVDDFQLTSTNNAYGQAVTWNGASFFAIGTAFDQASEHWIVRSSPTSAAGSWGTVDDVIGGEPLCLVVDSYGSVYVGGVINTAQGRNWIIRRHKSNPWESNSWETVDTLSSTGTSLVYGLAMDLYGNSTAVGADPSFWLTRISMTGDAGTWGPTDQVQLYPPYASTGRAIIQGPNGVLFAAGSAIAANSRNSTSSHWIVRQAAPQ